MISSDKTTSSDVATHKNRPRKPGLKAGAPANSTGSWLQYSTLAEYREPIRHRRKGRVLRKGEGTEVRPFPPPIGVYQSRQRGLARLPMSEDGNTKTHVLCVCSCRFIPAGLQSRSSSWASGAFRTKDGNPHFCSGADRRAFTFARIQRQTRSSVSPQTEVARAIRLFLD